MADRSRKSQNVSHAGSLSGALREILGKFLADMDDMLPAVVISYDRTTNRVAVRPLVRILRTDNTLLDRAAIASVPVLNIGGGNAVLSFNLLPGDLGWIKANDRDISLFLQNMADAPPNTLRKHSFNDGIFIPDQFKKWTLNVEDENFAVLQTLDGTQRISIQDAQIKITSDALVTIDAPLTALTGSLTVAGTIAGVGNIATEANLAAEGDVTGQSAGAAVVLNTHTHAQGNDSRGDAEVETDPPS